MKRRICLLLIVCTCFLWHPCWSQTLARSFAVSDMEPYASNYFKPFANAMPIGMSSGWYFTAKTHFKWGFNISFNGTSIILPFNENKFTCNSIDMPNYYFRKGGYDTRQGDQIIAPNITSNKISPPKIGVDYENEFVEITAISGLGIAMGGAGFIQASVAPIDGTEILIRFLPNMSRNINNLIPDSTKMEFLGINIWGVGVKQNINQWIKKLKYQESFYLSALLGYSQFNIRLSGEEIQITPEKFKASSTIINEYPNEIWKSQQFNMLFSSTVFSLICGYQYKAIHPYISLGISNNLSKIRMLGNYPVITENNERLVVSDLENNPINIKNTHLSYTLQTGASLTLGILVLHYQMTYQKYFAHTFGLAFTYN